MYIVLVNELTAIIKGYSIIVIDIKEVLRITNNCITNSLKVLLEERVEVVDIVVILEDERL